MSAPRRALERATTPDRGRLPPSAARRSPAVGAAVGLAALLVFAGFVALGTWQIRRLAWKLDLIDRVEARVHALPVAAPGPRFWPGMTADADEYRRVAVRGHFLNDRETDVQAVTDLGGGFWVMTPFETDDGSMVLINRGFVPPDRRDPATRPDGQIEGPTTVTGLLRMTEPKGAFLRSNDPVSGRWYSRDVAAIAAARGIGRVAPYFIDAEAAPHPAAGPVGGLTVVAFSNNHLVYALTWYGLAALLLGAGLWVVRDERRSRVIGEGP